MSRQTQASTVLPWSLEGDDFSGSETQFSPSHRQHDWALEGTSVALALAWQQSQWPYWNAWGVPIMPVPHSCQPSVTTSGKPHSAPPLPAAPASVQDVLATALDEELVPTARPPSSTDTSGPPLVVHSSSFSLGEVVAGPSRTSPPNDFCEHQALLRRVVANLGLEAEEMEEQMDTLFNVLSMSTLAQVMLPVHEGVLNIAKTIWQTPSSIPPHLKKGGKVVLCSHERVQILIHSSARGVVGCVVGQRMGQTGAHQFYP